MEPKVFDLPAQAVEALRITKDLCDGLQVNGKPVECFKVIVDIIDGNVLVESMSDEVLIQTYQQLKEYKTFWREISWFDNSAVEQVLPIVRSRFLEELKKRKL